MNIEILTGDNEPDLLSQSLTGRSTSLGPRCGSPAGGERGKGQTRENCGATPRGKRANRPEKRRAQVPCTSFLLVVSRRATCSSTLGSQKNMENHVLGRCEPTPQHLSRVLRTAARTRAGHPRARADGGTSSALWAKTAPAASAGSAGYVGSRPVDRSRAPIGAANTLSTAESHRIGR